MKHAVMVMLAEDDWIYVTENTGECDFDLRPMLFDSEDEAESFASAWRIAGSEKNVKVVEYDNLHK